jgi:hypothetical protein
MTTPTTADVGHGSMEPTVVQIDGFRGRLKRCRLQRRPCSLERCHRPAPARDRPMPRDRRRGRGRAFRPRARSEIAIRGGGHNVAGTAVCDEGIVIDLSMMRGVRVDPADRRARVVRCGATSTTRRRRMIWLPPVES